MSRATVPRAGSPTPASPDPLGRRPKTSWGRGWGAEPVTKTRRERGPGAGRNPSRRGGGGGGSRGSPGRAGGVAPGGGPRAKAPRGWVGGPGGGRVMWPLTVPPLLLLLLCSGLAGQVGARQAGAGAGGSRSGGRLSGFPQKRGLGLPEAPRAARGGGRRGGGAGRSTLALGDRSRASDPASSWDGSGDSLTPASRVSTPR